MVKELKLDNNTVVNWFNYCRHECDGSKENRWILQDNGDRRDLLGKTEAQQRSS